MTDLSRRRAAVLAQISAELHLNPDLPAPQMTHLYASGVMALVFETGEECEAWVSFLGVRPEVRVRDAGDRRVRDVWGHGDWLGWRLQLNGMTEVQR